MAKDLFFEYPTVDLFGNLQSKRKQVKSIKNTEEVLTDSMFFNGGAVADDQKEAIEKLIKESDLSDEIKSGAVNLPPGKSVKFSDINKLFGKDPNSVNPIIFNSKQVYNTPDKGKPVKVIIWDIAQRDSYKKEYDSELNAFLEAGREPKTGGSAYGWFFDWIVKYSAAEETLLTGNWVQKESLGFPFGKMITGGYIGTQRDNYNELIDVFKVVKKWTIENKIINKDGQIINYRGDFGGVFNLPSDPDPALKGPPTQTISGVTNKAPTVDNPNVKLPTQEVKSLTATSAKDAVAQVTPNVQVGPAITQVQSSATGALNQAQGAATGALNQAQGAVGNVQQSAGGILGNLSSGVTGAIGGGALGAGIGALAGGGKGALIGAGAGLVAGGLTGAVIDKLKPKADGMGKDWVPNKFSPESIAGNDKFVDPKTGLVGSTSKIAAGLKTGLAGGALGAGIGALAGGGQGALIGGLSGTALGAGIGIGGATGAALAGGGLGAGIGGIAGGGTGAVIGGVSGTALGAGLSVGGITGGALVGGGLGAGIGGIAGGGTGAAIGALSGGVVGAAAAKLASVQKDLPKPAIPKPPNTPRIKTVKIKAPNVNKTAEDALKSTSAQAQGQLQSISGQVSSLGNQAQSQLSSLSGQAQGQLNSLIPRG